MKKINSSLLPLIYKSSSRYSERSRPCIGQLCIFSHAIELTHNLFAPKAKEYDCHWLHSFAQCKVISNHPHLVEVRFEDADRNDLISPEFLTTAELTKFGHAFAKSSSMKGMLA